MPQIDFSAYAATLLFPIIFWSIGILVMPFLNRSGFLNIFEVIGLSWYVGLYGVGYIAFFSYLTGYSFPIKPLVGSLLCLLIVLNVIFQAGALQRFFPICWKEVLTNKALSKADWRLIIIILLLLIPLVSIALVNIAKPVWAYDNFLIWSLKAKLIYDYGISYLWTANDAYSHAQLDYPLLIPVCITLLNKMYGSFSEVLGNGILLHNSIATIFLVIGFAKRYTTGLIGIFLALILVGNNYMMLLSISGYMDALVSSAFFAFSLVLYFMVWHKKFAYIPLLAILAAGLYGIKAEGILLIFVSSAIAFCFLYKQSVKTSITFVLWGLIGILPHLTWFFYIKKIGLTNILLQNPMNIERIMSNLQDCLPIINYWIGAVADPARFFIPTTVFIAGLISLWLRHDKALTWYFIWIFTCIEGVYCIVLALFPADIQVILTTSFDRLYSHLLGMMMIPIILSMRQESVDQEDPLQEQL